MFFKYLNALCTILLFKKILQASGVNAVLNSGKIVSRVGDQTVVELLDSTVPNMGQGVFLDGKKVGAVFDIIGRMDKPYVVLRTRALSESSIGKQVQFK